MANEPRLAVESIAGQRPYQEDSVLAQNLPDGRMLVAVADGMGGHAAGEVASALALETLVAALENGHELDVAFTMANAEVHDKAREPGKQGMGTTLVAALVDDGEYMVANVGDSRGYLVSADGIRRLTEDHSFVAEAVKRGQSEEEAMATPWKDALTRSIGTEEHVEVDVFGPFPVKESTAILICSDGLYKTLTDDDLRRIYGMSGGPRGAAQSLVSSAYENGSDDNISVVIAEFGEVPRTVSQGTMPIAYVSDVQDESDAQGESDVQDEPDESGVQGEGHAAGGPNESRSSPTVESVPSGGTHDPTSEDETKAADVGAVRTGPPIGVIVTALVVVGVLVAAVLLGG